MSAEKILSRPQLADRRRQWRERGRRVVFTNGCFDLLHAAHVRLLEKARSLGDVLVVGLNSDDSVRELKGPNRPILPEAERAEVLAAFGCVDAVTIFEEPTPQELVRTLLPDVLVKGADWGKNIVGKVPVTAAGGEVVTLPYEPGHSTTSLIEKIAGLK